MTFDLTDPPRGFLDDPYPTYAWLRDRAPACVQRDGSFVISRHADLDRIYRDTDTYISDKKRVFGPKFGLGTPLYQHHTTSLVFNDPPLHSRVRRVMTGAMTPRALAQMEPGLHSLVTRLLDDLPAKPDLIADYAARIPIEVIGNLLGLPPDSRDPLRDWSLAILGALEPVLTPEQHATGNQAVTDFLGYLRAIIEDRRANPRDPETDVLTRLIQSDDDGGLSEDELYQNCIFILNAGHETTTNLIGNALNWLSHDRATRNHLIANPDLMAGATDEFLRLESPNQFGNRLTTKDITLHGTNIPKGTDLHLCIGAANRDPAQFDQPDQLNPNRKPNRHLAFAGGPHTCVGLTLARMEGRIALDHFLKRFPDYTITNATRSNRIRFRGFTRLQSTLT